MFVICAGNSRWVEQMVWSGQKEFGEASMVSFMVDGKEAGEMKSHGPLTFLKVCVICAFLRMTLLIELRVNY